MTLHEDIKYIEDHLAQTQSIEEIRDLLAQKKIELIVVIFSKKFNCFEWNITQGKTFKILDLKFRVRISWICYENVSFETVHSDSIRLKDSKWMDLGQVFQILKHAINKSLKRIEMFKDE